jgi:hypothetical protein
MPKTPIAIEVAEEREAVVKIERIIDRANDMELALLAEFALGSLSHFVALRIVERWADETQVCFLSIRGNKKWHQTRRWKERQTKQTEGERE